MSRAQTLVLVALLTLSAVLNLWHNDFPLGYHIDEPVKVAFIKDGTQNFNHPILMLQLVRAARLIAWTASDQAVVVLGRTIQAVCATAAVLVSFFLARRVLGSRQALVVAAGVAVSPTLVVHAHYLKEDTLLTLWLMAALLAFLMFCERPGPRTIVGLGLTTGLALSSHYKAALLGPLFVAVLWFRRPVGGEQDAPWGVFRQVVIAGLLAVCVFLAINWPLFLDVPGFLSGAGFEARHAVEGEDARIKPTDFWLGFHLLYSLAPGMTWPTIALGLAGLVWVFAAWRRTSTQDRLLAVYAVLFYLVPEVSPLRPPPDYSRYVMPIVPVLIYLGWRAVVALARTLPRVAAGVVTAAAATVLLAVPLYSSVRLTSAMGHDTRAQAAEWLAERGGRAILEGYAGLTHDVWTASDVDVTRARAEGVAYIVTSSFMYGRYALGSRLEGQDPEIYVRQQRYEALFRYPFVEIGPAYKSFGFTNPVIRIVRIDPGG